MDLGIFLASLGITLLEFSEAGVVASIYHGIYKNSLPFLYAIAGVLVVTIPILTLGKLITLIPIDYVLIVSGIILAYFGYKLLRSARRYFKHVKKWVKSDEEKKEGLSVVFTVSAVEALEAGLVVLALIPQDYISAVMGVGIASVIVIILTAVLKAQIARIRLPHVKFVLSALLFSLATMWFSEAFFDANELLLPLYFFVFLGVNYLAVKL